MKRFLHSLADIWGDILFVGKEELRQIFRDQGVIIFFFLVPLAYPVLYALIYNPETVHEAPLAVVDPSNKAASREFIRKIDAAPDVRVAAVCGDLEAARRLMDRGKVFGILSFPADFSADLHKGKQTTLSLYCDGTSLLYLKAFYLRAMEVSLDMGRELREAAHPASTEAMQAILVDPVPYRAVALFNSQGGFATFLVPAILILVIHQTLLLGICMLGGTAREKNRRHGLIPSNIHYTGTFRIVGGKALVYLALYLLTCIWVLYIIPRLFAFPQIGQPLTLFLFLLPFLFACIFMAMTFSGFMTSRESPMLLFVFMSIVLLFLSGISWPMEAMPPFWRAISHCIPATPGIRGFVAITTMGASLNEVAYEYHLLWIQAGFYFVTTCLIYRYQLILRKRKGGS
ncbi:MAG: ABC transporter permease [Tannerella sp.]|jgi:ABC-2 type transport system permease protein|nr:ABC transporter permease [Tannerella sp.]